MINTPRALLNGLSRHIESHDLSHFEPAVQKALQKLELIRDRVSIEPIIKKIAGWKSPFEQEFYVTFIFLKLGRRIHPKIHITEQYPILGKEKKYIVDFKLTLADEIFPDLPPLVALVECDSYSYHDRTPQQFDEERERIIELQRHSGGRVYPFTGNKLRKGVDKCVIECTTDLQRDLATRREMFMRV